MNEYAKHINELWVKAGGLITPAIAAKMLGITTARIAQMQDEGKITVYKDKTGKTMLSLAEINKLLIEKDKNTNKEKSFIVTYKIKGNEEKEIKIKQKTEADLNEIMQAIIKDAKKHNIKIEEDNIESLKINQDPSKILSKN